MTVNGCHTRCSGPGFEAGASTKPYFFCGGEMGSTGVEKAIFRSAWYHRYRAKLTSANDNMELAVAA